MINYDPGIGAGYPSYGAQEPKSIKVIGICGIIIGVLGLLCGFVGIGNFMSKQTNPVLDELAKSPLVLDAMQTIPVVMVVLSLLVIPGAIGVMNLSNVGRQVVLIYAIVMLVVGLADLVTQFGFAFPILEDMLVFKGRRANEEANLFGMQVGFFCRVMLFVAYSVAALVILNLEDVKAAFARGNAVNGAPPNRSNF